MINNNPNPGIACDNMFSVRLYVAIACHCVIPIPIEIEKIIILCNLSSLAPHKWHIVGIRIRQIIKE